MKVSKIGLDIIKFYESFREAPYLCPAGIPTIGYGATFYEDGTRVTLSDPPISKERAEVLLATTLQEFERGVESVLKRTPTQGQFDGMVSFAFNVGLANFRKSTLLAMFNSGKIAEAAAQFDRWIYAAGKVLKGLVNRRNAEKARFLTT